MTTPVVENDYWFCKRGPHMGEPHSWLYRGKKLQLYRCLTCALVVTKATLKGATDDA